MTQHASDGTCSHGCAHAVALSKTDAKKLLSGLDGWRLYEENRGILKEFMMKDFVSAVEFIRRIAAVAEKINHHPDLHLVSYRRLAVFLSTHEAHGLTANDFELASRIDKLPKKLKKEK